MMAVQNRLTKPADQQERGLTEYEVGGQMVKLSPSMVRQYLVNGNGAVTDQEVMMFISLCKFQRLNPFLREAYLIKYGQQPATIVTGKEAFLKRAMRSPMYEGIEAGVVVLLENGLMDNRVGTIVLENEKLLGGWAKVYVMGWKVPMMITVPFDEYVGRKSNGEVNQQWSTKPASMIRKVAIVQALREAFPDDLGGMYTAEEKQVEDLPEVINDVPVVEVEVEEEPAEQPAPVEQPEPVEEAKPVRKSAITTEVTKKPDNARDALFGK